MISNEIHREFEVDVGRTQAPAGHCAVRGKFWRTVPTGQEYARGPEKPHFLCGHGTPGNRILCSSFSPTLPRHEQGLTRIGKVTPHHGRPRARTHTTVKNPPPADACCCSPAHLPSELGCIFVADAGLCVPKS